MEPQPLIAPYASSGASLAGKRRLQLCVGRTKQLNQYVRPLALTITGTLHDAEVLGDGGWNESPVAGCSRLADSLAQFSAGPESGALIQVPASNNNLGAELGRNIPAAGTSSTYFNTVPGQNPLLVDPELRMFQSAELRMSSQYLRRGRMRLPDSGARALHSIATIDGSVIRRSR